MDGLGETIRQERKKRRLRLQAIADRAGLTASFLSQVERNVAVPSLSSLALIAQAIGVDMRSLLPPVAAGSDASRHGARIPFGPNQQQIAYEQLSAAVDDSRLNALKLRVMPGYRSETSTHAGEEFVYVVDGSIRYIVGDVVYDLYSDDTLHFSSGQPHRVENVTTGVAEYISVGTFNMFGEAVETDRPDAVALRGRRPETPHRTESTRTRVDPGQKERLVTC